MAKKFVRGITDIKTINNQDFDTNNVNDLLSDGKNNYIHRKKQDGSEEYHNLTNNLKTVTSDNTDLLEVTNNNDTTNSAVFHPKHDSSKEQSLESTRGTITITHAENGTSGTTKVDTNPLKVLEHEKLLTGYGVDKTFNEGTSTLVLQPTRVSSGFNLNTMFKGKVVGENLVNAPTNGWFMYENDYFTINNRDYVIQTATRYKLYGVQANEKYIRTLDNNTWGVWMPQLTDKATLDTALASKQNTLTNNASIGVAGTGLRQLYALKQTYTATGGVLKTHVKSVSENTSISTSEEEFNFIVKLNKNVSDVTFTLNSHDTTKFSNIITTYGENNTVRISGCVFTLSGSILTVSTTNNTAQNYVITFSDII